MSIHRKLLLLAIHVTYFVGVLSQTSGTTTAATPGGLVVAAPSTIPPQPAIDSRNNTVPIPRDLQPDVGSPYAFTTQTPEPVTSPAPPVVPDCFWEGNFYKPGTDIVRGQKDYWCYVTYCDSKGQVQFWDDYNCPANSMKSTSRHTSGRNIPASPDFSSASSGTMGRNKIGCEHGGKLYQPEQDISNNRIGDRCYGTFCSLDSKVVNWEDWCTHAPQGQGQIRKGHGSQRHGVQGTPAGRQHRQDGCYHKGHYYGPNEPVISGNVGDMCYGYYCEGRNTFVHWEDHCGRPVAATSQENIVV